MASSPLSNHHLIKLLRKHIPNSRIMILRRQVLINDKPRLRTRPTPVLLALDPEVAVMLHRLRRTEDLRRDRHAEQRPNEPVQDRMRFDQAGASLHAAEEALAPGLGLLVAQDGWRDVEGSVDPGDGVGFCCAFEGFVVVLCEISEVAERQREDRFRSARV